MTNDSNSRSIAPLEQLRRIGASRRVRRLAIGLVAAFALLGLFGFLAGPPIARHFLVDTLSQRLHRPVSLGEVSINPYAMTVRVTDFRIGTRDKAEGETAGFDELFLNVSLASLFRAAPVVEEFRLVGPRVHLVHEAPGRYNVSDLLDEWLKPSDSPPPRFSVNNITVTNGRFEFDDRPVARKHVVSNIKLALPFISNLAYQANNFTEPAFSANVNGAPFELTGRSKPFGDVKEAELKLELDRFNLAPYLVYSPVALPFSVTSGQLDTDIGIVFRNDGKQPASLAIAGKAAVKDLKLFDQGGAPLLAIGQIDIPIAGVEPLGNRYRFGEIRIDGLDASVRVDNTGALNWLAIAGKLSGSGKAEPPPAAKRAPVEWSVEGIRVGKSTVHWLDETQRQPLAANVTGIEIGVGKVDGQFSQPVSLDAAWSLDAAPYAAAERFEIKGARIDVPARKAALGEFALRGLKLAATRLADGSIATLLPPRLQPVPVAKATREAAADGGAPWTVSLAKAEMTDASLRFDDRAMTPMATQAVDIGRLTITDFSTAAGASANVELAATLNKKGVLQASGQVQVEPAAAKLKFDLRGLELLPLQRYFGEKLNLTVTRGQVASRGELALNRNTEGGFAGGFRGQITIGNFHSVDKANSEDFLTWKSFHIDKMDLKLQPFALAIGEVALSDFFANLYVSPEGKLNLMQIVRKDDAPGEPGEPKPQPTEASPPAAPPDSSTDNPADKAAAAPVKTEKKPPPPIRIDQVTLQGGTVNIDDHFIQPNYSAHLTEIGGRVAGLSSEAGSTADLDLRGAYDGAPVTIAGKLNPLATLPSLDLKAEVRGIEMTPLSPYAGKYAGYAIDKGKLSLFLTYRIADNKLQADNRIFLDQLTFGEKIESPSATKLPVLLAVALLKNRRGEIDINLPISGSLDDPKFSVGGIIVQVIVNVITKAITAPFALLGSLFGGGVELSHADFAAGHATLGEASIKRLEALAKALDDRPALKLEITGRVDPEKDREGLRQATLEHKVKAQKLARLVKAGKEAGSVDEVTVEDKEYLPLLEQAYKQEKFPKPRNFVGLAKSLPREEMEKLMLANAPASDDDLRELANDRAKAVADWLAGPGKIPRERIFLLPPKIADDGSGPKDAPLNRAEFSLK